MKITAHFDSADSADFAAGALKNALSPLASVDAREEYPNPRRGNTVNAFAAFNTATYNPAYAMPMINANDADPALYENDYTSAKHVLEVVCRSEEAAAASRIIIGHGGRDITRL
ncbi:MAG: hypothetical protein NC253_14560 [Ruminococcus sp.]|nr:hypothetical protein [Ruminococcus sp.]